MIPPPSSSDVHAAANPQSKVRVVPPRGGGYRRPAQPTPSRHGYRPVADGARYPPLHSIAGATVRARPTLATSAAPSNPCPFRTILPSDQWPCLSFVVVHARSDMPVPGPEF